MIPISTAFARLGWNERVLTYEMFEEVCEQEGILLYDVPSMPVPGFYKIEAGFHVIAIDRRLRGWKRTLVAFHELAHYCLDVPGKYGHHAKSEMHAQAIALIAVLPTYLLNLPDGELIEIYGYPSEVVAERVRIFKAFNK